MEMDAEKEAKEKEQGHVFETVKLRWFPLIFLGLMAPPLIWLSIIGPGDDNPLSDEIFGILLYIVSMGILWFVLNRRKVRFWRTFYPAPSSKMKGSEILYLLVTVILLSIGAYTILYVPLSYVFPGYVDNLLQEKMFYSMEEYKHSVSVYAANTLMILTTVIAAPFCEEVLFRGAILHRLTFKWGIKAGIFVSSFLFGILHFDIIGAFVFGMIMCLLYLRTQSLRASLALHLANNLTAILIASLLILADGKETVQTLESFQKDWVGGAVCFVIALPMALIWIRKNWPRGGRV